jgi:hypothetical protein
MYTPIQGIEKAYFHQHKTDHPPVDLTFSDDGNKLFVGFYQDGGSVETFHLNVSLATWVRTERIHGDNIGRAVAVSSDGSVLATASTRLGEGNSEQDVFVYSANTTGRLELQNRNSIYYPRTGSHIDVSGDGGRIMVVSRGPSAWSQSNPNTYGNDRTIRVYDTYEKRSDVYNDVTFDVVLAENNIPPGYPADVSIAISPNASFLVVATSYNVRTFFDERCAALGGPAPPYSPPPAPPPPLSPPPTPPPPPKWGGVSFRGGSQIPGTYYYNFTVITDTPAWFALLQLHGQSSYKAFIYSQNATENRVTRTLPGPGQYFMLIQPVLEECEDKEPFLYCLRHTVEGTSNHLRYEYKKKSFEVIALPPPSPPPISPPPNPQAPWPPITPSPPHPPFPPFNSTAGDTNHADFSRNSLKG